MKILYSLFSSFLEAPLCEWGWKFLQILQKIDCNWWNSSRYAKLGKNSQPGKEIKKVRCIDLRVWTKNEENLYRIFENFEIFDKIYMENRLFLHNSNQLWDFCFFTIRRSPFRRYCLWIQPSLQEDLFLNVKLIFCKWKFQRFHILLLQKAVFPFSERTTRAWTIVVKFKCFEY